MTTRTYTATFGSTTYRRTTEATYPYAAYRRGEYGGATVTFHKTYAAAKRTAGRFGHVSVTEEER